MLFEAHKLPVIGIVGEGKTRLAGETDHRLVGSQGVAEDPCGAKRSGTAFEILQQRRAEPMALPAVAD
jgi:hypothetical protein